MSMKILEPANLRAEMARERITRREVASALGLSYDYILKILSGSRKAPERGVQIHEYILGKTRNKEIRGIT
jgi:transcriptional regulator with XRE-family HTH domain